MLPCNPVSTPLLELLPPELIILIFHPHTPPPQLIPSSLLFRNFFPITPSSLHRTTIGCASIALSLSQVFSHHLKTALLDLITRRGKTCPYTLCQRKTSTQLTGKQGRVKTHESAVLWSELFIRGTVKDKYSYVHAEQRFPSRSHLPCSINQFQDSFSAFFYRKFYQKLLQVFAFS